MKSKPLFKPLKPYKPLMSFKPLNKQKINPINKILSNKNFNYGKQKGASINMQKQWGNMPLQKKVVYNILNKDTDRDGVPNKWDCQPRNPKKQGWSHVYSFNDENKKNLRTVMMPPKQFLDTTYQESKLNSFYRNKTPESYDSFINNNLRRSSVDWHKTAIPSKKEKVEIPFLEFDKWGRPIGHEGRHTSQAAVEEGIKLIPVTIEQKRYQGRYEVEPKEGEENIYDKNNVTNLLNSNASYYKQYVDKKNIYRPEQYKDVAKKTLEKIEEYDSDQYCSKGNCKPISEDISQELNKQGIQAKQVKVITPNGGTGGHYATYIPQENKVIDTQTWQYDNERHYDSPQAIETRQTEFTKEEYKQKGFQIQEEDKKVDLFNTVKNKK